MDTAIVDTTLLTFRDERLGIVDDGSIAVEGGEIRYVGPASGLDVSDAETVIDGNGCVTLPGLVNAHAHTEYTLLRGGAQDVPEIEWMSRALGPFASKMTAADRVAGARLGVLEALSSGVTTVVEYARDVTTLVDEVYRPYGSRVVATETINEVPDDRADLGPRELYPFDREQGAGALERANALFDDYADDPLVTPMYGPQALDMVSPELLDDVRTAARDRDARIHMHVAQGDRERLQIEERYGTDATTVSVLAEHGVLSDRLVAAHCHGTTATERERMVKAGVNVVACPSSIAAIDGIVPPLTHYESLGGTVGLGTDQAPGPGNHDLLREIRTASLLSKTDAGDPTALPAWKALRLATIEGARVLGLDDRIGSLEAGKRADIVTVDAESIGLTPAASDPFHTVVPNLVYSATGADVRDVFVDGNPVVRDGEFVEIDPRAAVEEASERAARVFRAGAADWREAGSELVKRVDEGWI